MKKIYIKPSIVVEKAVLPAIMDILSAGKLEFGGGSGGTGDGTTPTIVESKYSGYDGFGTLGTYDDEDDY